MGIIYQTKYAGYVPTTAENIISDVGALFLNYDLDTDTYATALAAGKLLGTTQGTVAFNAIPTYRQPQINGIKGKAKGLNFIEMWDVNLQANVFTISTDTLAKALAAADVDATTEDFYDIITARNYVELGDYIGNITYVGRISGAQNPIIIQMYNCINLAGLALSFTDGSDAIVPVNYSATTDLTDPLSVAGVSFVIVRPKAEGAISGTVTDSGTPVVGATVAVTIDGVTLSTLSIAAGVFLLEGVPYDTVGYTVTATKDAKTGTTASGVIVGGATTAAGAIAIA